MDLEAEIETEQREVLELFGRQPQNRRTNHVDGIRPESQVRKLLTAGGKRIRTAGPTCDRDAD
jgi:hypothetical protein